jgi:hypothetical protein
VRNATRLSIAPTGTLSLIAGTSGGIEPLFALAYRRTHSLGGAALVEMNPLVVRHATRSGADPDRLRDTILACGTLRGVSGIPQEVRRLFLTALEIPRSATSGSSTPFSVTSTMRSRRRSICPRRHQRRRWRRPTSRRGGSGSKG